MVTRRNFILSTLALLTVPVLPTLAGTGRRDDFVNCSLHCSSDGGYHIFWQDDRTISYAVSRDGGAT